MFLRFPLLLLCLLSLAFGPVQLSAACMLPVAMAEATCSACCPENGSKAMSCCNATDAAAPVKVPVAGSTQVDDGKLLASPVLVVLGVVPVAVVERPAFYREMAAQIPVPRRLDLICIRLI